ncbi:MAG: hypothetical protein JW934_00660 [Anaerolineae bacterium]|nr:hypothetical protein [Anaerolineae bacterium]
MNEHEREQVQADALDAHLDQLQTGQSEDSVLETDRAQFVESLVELARSTHPDAAFAARLETRLRAQARKRTPAAQRHPSNALQGIAATWIAVKERMSTMNRRLVYSMAGAAILALILFAALALINPNPSDVGPTHVAQQFTATSEPTIQPTHTPLSATATPAIKSTQPPTSTPMIAPTVTPAPTPAEPIPLPALAEWQGSGYGGGTGEPVPLKRTYVLGVALPNGPAQMTVYLQHEPERLTALYAAQFAKQLGVAGRVYQSIRLASVDNPDEEPFRGYLTVDGAREVMFEASGLVYYTDRNHTPYVEGYWREPESVPPLEQAIQAAKAFLQSAGLLDSEVQVAATGDTLLVYRVLDGQWPLLGPIARVNIWGDGQVGQAQVWPLSLDMLAEYPIISAEKAWSLLNSGQPDGRVWQYPYHAADLPAWGEWQHQNPTFWTRPHIAGRQVHRFGAPQVWFPTETHGTPYVTMGNLMLTGDVQPLADYIQQQYIHEQPIYAHVWGKAQDADDRQTLLVEGWEPAQETYWNGTVRRQGDQSTLATNGGRTILLSDLPADLSDGTVVAVSGGQVDDRLEWHLIQVMSYAEPSPGEQVSEVNMTVEQIDLVYLALAPDVIPPESYADLGIRAVQPVWRFRGHTDQGAAFEVYVQAVAESYLDN